MAKSQQNNDSSTSDWMADLDDSLGLDELSIPGTHDSGTHGVSDIVQGAARTQNFGIATQLRDGIRFLDIRLKPNGDTSLDVYHGIISCNLTFDTVLTDCKNFLSNHSTEVIIMLVNAASSDDHDKIETPFLNSLDRLGMCDQFVLDARPGTLCENRGKVVLFRRFGASGTLGVDLATCWPDDGTAQFTNGDGLSFDIEDAYAQHDTNKKWSDVSASLDRATASSGDGVYHITYNSISAGGHTPYQYAWGGGLLPVDPVMNPTLDNYLADEGSGRLGAVMMDYYNNEGDDNDLVPRIIAANPS